MELWWHSMVLIKSKQIGQRPFWKAKKKGTVAYDGSGVEALHTSLIIQVRACTVRHINFTRSIRRSSTTLVEPRQKVVEIVDLVLVGLVHGQKTLKGLEVGRQQAFDKGTQNLFLSFWKTTPAGAGCWTCWKSRQSAPSGAVWDLKDHCHQVIDCDSGSRPDWTRCMPLHGTSEAEYRRCLWALGRWGS